MFTMLFTIIGLAAFEVVSSIDNAVINAEVLQTMSPKARRWFLIWGMLFAVVAVRGLLPWLIVWGVMPDLGPIGALMSTMSSDPLVHLAVEKAAPVLFAGGGTFLLFLFFHWLFLEEKHFGLPHEKFFARQGLWFYAVVSILLAFIVWTSLSIEPFMAFGAVIGSTAFFITHGFKDNAERAEKELLSGNTKRSDISKILYLEAIDTTFSIDGVLGAFAFTLSVPLILIGNGIGALVVRQLTVSNIETIKKYIYLKNGAMYSLLILGIMMMCEAFGIHLPQWGAPLATVLILAAAVVKSRRKMLEAG
ncbi:MAG: DUF475 domain-containing protein [Patescibacteria group bacterium]